MVKIRKANENDMVYAFLSMEIQSDRYSEEINKIIDALGIDKRIIIAGDITNPHENKIRRDVLGRFRGYGEDRDLFENFPDPVDWEWTVFENAELNKIRYINYSYWNELSNYSGSPLEAAKAILSGKIVYDVPNDGFLAARDDLENGVTFPPLIMLTDHFEQRYIVLEGHKRITAYALTPEYFSSVSVLLGYCDAGSLQKWYGEMPSPASI